MNEVPSTAVGSLGPRQGYNRDRWIETPINMGYGQLAGTSGTLYTAPTGSISGAASQKARLTEVILCNTDTVERTATLYVVEVGGSVADNRAILKDCTIAAKTTYVCEFATIIESGETIRGLASSASKVTYRLTGVALT